ncbi:STY4534 family ICE replication protein [Pectobacterium sp. B2J-2]|uniref:STY4534 family ICE replication protein n=1 Tax=Pectobacterium sp. B2J-2 TaxID=3385372 RepID=UPI0038FCC3E7
MTANKSTLNQGINSQNGKSNEYFNLNLNGLGYLSDIRHVTGPNGQFTTCVINALSGHKDSVNYVRFDVTPAGKETIDLIKRCEKAVDEDKKVLINFALSNLSPSIFTLNSGDHAGEQRISLKARLIKITRIKVGKEITYQAEKSDPSDSTPAQNTPAPSKAYAANSF